MLKSILSLFGADANARVHIGRKTADLEARLSPVGGSMGRGELEFSAWADGSRQLEVELRDVAGHDADVYVNGSRVVSVPVSNGRCDEFFDTRQGDALPAFSVGAAVEIRQSGETILSGAFQHD